MNQEVRDGKFAFVVYSVEGAPEIHGTARPYEVLHPQGEYIVVHMTVSNTEPPNPNDNDPSQKHRDRNSMRQIKSWRLAVRRSVQTEPQP
jgi:hypothetical protein